MDVSKLVRSNFVPLVLMVLLVGGLVFISRHWPTAGDDAAKVQAIAGVIGLVAAIIVAVMTWAYIKTTYEMLEVQQATLNRQRPRVAAQVVWSQCVVDGPTPDYARVNFSLVVRAEFRNLSLGTPTTLTIVQGGLEDYPEQRMERAFFGDRQAAGTPNPNAHPLGPGESAALNMTVKISFPNRNDALPDGPLRGILTLRDTFNDQWEPLAFETRLA